MQSDTERENSHHNKPESSESQMQDVLVNVVDLRAKQTPQLLYAEIPVSETSYIAGYRKVNYRQLANAVNGAARYLHNALGPGENFETLAYIGPNDLRYNIFILGAIKAGYKIFVPSPRNHIAAHLDLFENLDCKTIIAANPRPLIVSEIVSSTAPTIPLRVLDAPTLEELLGAKHGEYPYAKSFEEARHDPFVVFHTSGSTGMPKPIVWSHDFVAEYIRSTQMNPPKGFEMQTRLFQGSRIFFLLPPFHAANHVFTLCNAIANRSAWIYPIAGAILSAQLLAEGLRHTKADAAFITPSMVVELSKNVDMLEFICSKVATILCSGGSVPTDCGNLVAKSVDSFANVYGSSEQGSLPQLQHTSSSALDDWEYIHFHPDIGAEFCRIEEDLYELRIEDAQIKCQPVFKLYPDLPIFHTGDLFSPHPVKSNLWRYSGRLDDMIVFSTGEKTNPITMENHVASHPDVKSALVAGDQRFQAALIVELQENRIMLGLKEAEIIERIWPIIEEANRDCPKYAKVSKSHILLAPSSKPFARAGKGTIQRRLTLKTYTEELDALYADAEGLHIPFANKARDRLISDPHSLRALIWNSIKEITEWKSLDHDANFFINGMDSLQTLNLTRKLRRLTAISDIAPNTVYSNPSVVQLAEAISRLLDRNHPTAKAVLEDQKQEVNELLAEYQALIDGFSAFESAKGSIANDETAAAVVKEGRVVLLTGSTGALGSHILEVLLRDSSVRRIYCLNRASNSLLLQKERNETRSLPVGFPSDRVTFLTVNLARPRFGLESQIYNDLLCSTTDIILNAWPVNFNIPLAAFREQLSGICNVINFGLNAHQSPSILFISSISAVLLCDHSPIPETIIFDPTVPASMGYGKSKYIAERLLHYAAEKLHVSARIARVGQISGPVRTGSGWNRSEWLPSLVITSSNVRAVPDRLGSLQQKIDWIPMDVLAEVLVELAFKPVAGLEGRDIVVEDDVRCSAIVFHVMNPHPTTWDALLPSVIETLRLANQGKGDIEIVSFEKWLQKLKEAADVNIADVNSLIETNPAVKMVDAYETLLSTEAPEFVMDRVVRASTKLKEVEAISPYWVRRWCKEWLGLREREMR
ncbi:hypothetical protein F5884DRAFT_758350 [Xylogone sp. PMI_703]|nr:hypothetical protein F5884DRAFT_758350 [Xylogone sp. PMI_703]